jgi:prevent-host-death family protein
MEKTIPVEEARRKLGQLIVEVASSKEPVIIARRNSEKAVLMNYNEYERLQAQEARAAEERFESALQRIHAAVREARVKPQAVKSAIRKARRD